MAITAGLVKELRERTGAPMMECKKALVNTDGDIEGAIELMRKSGQTKADKKAGRVAAEGALIIKASADDKQAVLIEINSETDFVARDSNFIAFVEQVADAALQAQCSDVAALATVALGDATVETARQNLVAKIGENVNIRRMQYIVADNAVLGHYVHSGRIAVIVNMRGGDAELAKSIAMHIAASAPQVVKPEQVPSALVDKEREIFTAQAADSGKPADIIEKMVEGRVKKFLQEVSLLGQPYVKDPSMNVAELLKQTGAEVESFTRFVLGEGIEKQESNFAEEVMAQVQSS